MLRSRCYLSFLREMKAVEVPAGAVRDEEEIELDLGLSIGGSFRKLPEKSSGLSQACVRLSRSTTSGSSLTLVSDGDEESAVVDPKERGEIQGVRRREAKRKREEKRQKRGRSFASVEEGEERHRPLKREKQEGVGSECNAMKNVDLNLSDDQVDSRDNRRASAPQPKRDPAGQMPYQYSPLQYVPFLNGYAFPCVMPYWAAGGAISHGSEKNVHQPVACRSFRPFQTYQNTTDVGCHLEQNGSKNRRTGSCGSPVCSSSVISDNYQSSSSHEGGGSNYTGSNSSNSSLDRRQMICPNPNDPTDDRPSSNHVKPKPYSDNRTQCPEKSVQSHVSKTSITTGIKKEPIASNKDEGQPLSKPVFNSLKSQPMSPNNIKMENGKPPKPQIQIRNIPSLQQMPCVTTTGVGPDGKTITGFLYRYSNLEVSILCVCHGESFSPAEFVKHAGGGQVSHPLRHITVLPTNGIPSAIR